MDRTVHIGAVTKSVLDNAVHIGPVAESITDRMVHIGAATEFRMAGMAPHTVFD